MHIYGLRSGADLQLTIQVPTEINDVVIPFIPCHSLVIVMGYKALFRLYTYLFIFMVMSGL